MRSTGNYFCRLFFYFYHLIGQVKFKVNRKLSTFTLARGTLRKSECNVLQVCRPREERQMLAGRAGHFRYFGIFSITKNDFLHFLSS